MIQRNYLVLSNTYFSRIKIALELTIAGAEGFSSGDSATENVMWGAP